jgi:FtsH-binding integral membrane protein
MKERRDFIQETKTEMINDLLNSPAFKVAKFISLGLVITGGLGYVFKVLAFTNNNYNKFKSSMNV